MPLKIPNIDHDTFAYETSNNSAAQSPASTQTKETQGANKNLASKELEALRNYCFDPSVPLKGGTLRLVKNSDGSIQLKRRQWYQFWNFVGWGRDTGRAAAYVNSLLKEQDLVKESNNSTNSTNSALAAYVQVSSNKVTLEELSRKLLPFTLQDNLTTHKNEKENNGVEANTNATPSSSPVSIPLSGLETQTVTDKYRREFQQLALKSVQKFCPSVGLTVGDKLGEGGMGTVYHASVLGRTEGYVIKLENKFRMESIINAENLPFDQRGDLAATTVQQLGHITQPIFVIVALKKTPSDSIQYHYLPVANAKSFVQKMQKECPYASLAIAGQLMEKVPGNELSSCIHGEDLAGKTVPKIDCTITQKPFQQIAYQLLKSMKVSMEKKFIHRDLKPENIMVTIDAQGNYHLKLIDGGFSAQGNDKPLKLHKFKGTLQYMSPRVYNANEKNTYGAEADFYSTAMILLEMISPEDFNRVNEIQKMDTEKRPQFLIDQSLKQNNTTYANSKDLENYLSAAGPISQIATTLQDPKNKEVRNLIDLSFQASRGGKQGQEAYKTWQKTFAAWETTLKTNDVIPKADRVVSNKVFWENTLKTNNVISKADQVASTTSASADR